MSQFWQGFSKASNLEGLDKILVGKNADGSTQYADVHQLTSLLDNTAIAGTTVVPSIVPSNGVLGSPPVPTIYYAPAGTYTTPTGSLVLSSALNILFWNLTAWSSLPVNVSVDSDKLNALQSAVGSTNLQNYSKDFAGANTRQGANYDWGNKVPLSKSGVLVTLRVKGVADEFVQPKCYSISTATGTEVATVLHTYANIKLATTGENTLSIADAYDFLCPAGSYIAVAHSGGVYTLDSSADAAFSVGFAYALPKRVAMDFVINETASLVNLQTKILGLLRQNELTIDRIDALNATNSTQQDLIESMATIAENNKKLHYTQNLLDFANYYTTLSAIFYDGSTWEKKTGDKSDNGGIYAGTIIRVNSSVYWERKVESSVNVSWFGYDAKAASGDCYTALSTAVSVAALLSGGADSKKVDVFLPEGVWNYNTNITITVPNNVRIKGASKTRTLIYINSTVSTTLFTFAAGSGVSFDNCIENLTIKNGSATIAHTAIKLLDVSTAITENIVIGSDVNGGYFKGVGIDINGREVMTFERLRIYADSPVIIRPNPNNSISIDLTTFRDNLFASPAVAGNKIIEIKSNVNLTNVQFEGHNDWVGGQYGLYWNDTQTVAASVNFNIKNVRQEQEVAGGYMIYINHNTSLQTLTLENVYGALLANFIYIRKVEKVSMINCFHPGTSISINAVANNLNYNIAAINFYKNGTLNLSGYNLNKFGNDTYFWTYIDNNILSNNIVTNSNGIGVNATPTAEIPNIIVTPLSGDSATGLMLGSTGSGSLNRSINVIFNDFVDANGTYNVALRGERENIGADWQGSFKVLLNTLSVPNPTISTLTEVLVFNGRLRTAYIADKINSNFYKSASARVLSLPLGTLNFDASGAIGTQPLGQMEYLTTTQINTISSPMAGRSVINSTLGVLCFYNGSEWKRYDGTNM